MSILRWSPSDDFPAISASACDVSSNSDRPGSSPAPLLLPDTDLPTILDSFIPILSLLPGFYLDKKLYHIRGSITAEDWTRLRHYSRTVSKFVLTDAANEDSKAQISPAAFLRLARLQQHDVPFLPSLTDIAIDGADKTMEYLELLLTPSLKSLEASRIPDAMQPTFFSFLTAVEQEAPLLQTLVFGQGRYPPGSLQIIAKFNNLRHLELKYEDSDLPVGFFDDIGSLPKLEAFILDARYVSSNASNASESTNRSSTTFESRAMEAVDSPPSNDSRAPDFDSNRYQEDGSDYVLHSQTPHTPVSTSGGRFNQLAKLHVVGGLPLIQDLITCITSTILQDVSISIIHLSDDILRREEPKSRADAEYSWVYECSSYGWKEEAMREEAALEILKHLTHVYTTDFVETIRILCSRWTTSLKAVSVCQLDKSFQCPLEPPTLPEETFRALLLLPAIENLEVKGWTLDFVESVLYAIQLLPNLKSLLLPLDGTNSGISLHALRHVAEICPKLESFQCSIEPLSEIPVYPVPATDALSHGLRELSVGNSFPLPDTKRLRLIARHLYLLFPHLETIDTSQEHNAEQWIIVDDLVKICQMARRDDMNRPPATPNNNYSTNDN